ncbi:MAG: hypothetical protein N2114_06060 [Candidatus Goldbacteria bacterium]|nr:hypothetical protein [Candidatus Goldiibacteriota bacterium]
MKLQNIKNSFDTESPLNFDYFNINENVETETIANILREYNEIAGLTVNWYRLLDSNSGMDPVFLERADKKWAPPIPIKVIFEYLQEVIETQKYGIQILDELNMICEKKYWEEKTKITMPQIGDLFFVEHVGLMFEATNVVDSEANFWGNKLTWKITAKIFHTEHEDKNINTTIQEAGWMSEEIETPLIPTPDTKSPHKDNLEYTNNINKNIEEKSEELHTYTPGDNPFGNF